MNEETKERDLEDKNDKSNSGCLGPILFCIVFIFLGFIGHNMGEQENEIIKEIESYENYGKDVKKKVFHVGTVDVKFKEFKSFKPSKGHREYYVIYEKLGTEDLVHETYKIEISKEEYGSSKFYGPQTIKVYLSKSLLTFGINFTYLDGKAYLLYISFPE